jgi:uncharacterized protein YjgD (DUF1641 family)
MDNLSNTFRKIALPFLLAAFTASVTPALAGTATPATPATKHATQAKQDTIARAKQQALEKDSRYSKEAVSAIHSVQHAITLLDQGKNDEALKALQDADGKLEVAIAADPALKMIPVSADVTTIDLETTPKAVSEAIDSITYLLEAGNVQQARTQLNRLSSQIVGTYVYLPTATYPDAIKRAVAEITEQHGKQARATLAAAMDSLVEETVVTPIPVIMAQSAILAAEKAQDTDRDQALQDLDYASEQIETAKRLGYFFANKDDYNQLTGHIDTLRSALTGKSKIAELFDNVKHSLEKLLDHEHNGHAPADTGKPADKGAQTVPAK